MIQFLGTFTSGQHIGALVLIFVFTIIELLLRRLKRQKSKEYQEKKSSINSLEEIEDVSLEHYRQLQQVDVIRFLAFVLGILMILGAYNVQVFSLLAVAAGAFILALRESFSSFIAYFYILSNFKLGDDIKINGFLGEIVRIKPLYTSLAGKDENGDHNSKLYNIPNFMFLGQSIEQQQLKSDDYRKLSLQILYTRKAFADDFPSWIEKMEVFLKELLPKRAMTKVGHFKGYAGIRYKMDFDYNDKGEVVVKISFITRTFKILKMRKSIITYVETLKKQPKDAISENEEETE